MNNNISFSTHVFNFKQDHNDILKEDYHYVRSIFVDFLSQEYFGAIKKLIQNSPIFDDFSHIDILIEPPNFYKCCIKNSKSEYHFGISFSVKNTLPEMPL